jgi:hypothetical protein
MPSQRVNHGERDGDLLTRGGRQWLCREPRPASQGQQFAALWAAVVIQDRLDTLLPLTPPMRQRVPQPDLSAEIQR